MHPGTASLKLGCKWKKIGLDVQAVADALKLLLGALPAAGYAQGLLMATLLALLIEVPFFSMF
jgi:hypothetical protein